MGNFINFVGMENSNLTPEELTTDQSHYSESDFWLKLGTLAKKVGVKLTYYALTLYYTLTDPGTPTKYKAVIAGALGYMILPLDLVPDFLPFAGLADDWAALIAAVSYVIRAITPENKEKAREKLRSWFPDATEADLGDLA